MAAMEPDGVVFSVACDKNEQWHVTTQEFAKPLASFNDPRAACAWAIRRAKPVHGQVLIGEIPVIAGHS
ncbi:MAG: hypothetical protein ABIS45_00295 [Burkholderiales bacterium]